MYKAFFITSNYSIDNLFSSKDGALIDAIKRRCEITHIRMRGFVPELRLPNFDLEELRVKSNELPPSEPIEGDEDMFTG